jgi:N-acetylglucosamine-6-phosphate deacetylase
MAMLQEFGIETSNGHVIDISGNADSLLPGFIDVHNHGAVGHDVNTASAEDLLEVAAFLARHGVTAWMPTLVPDSDENYRRVVGEIDTLMQLQLGRPVAQAVGVHYEGVFAAEKMCGALRPEYFKKFTGKEVDELPRLSSGVHMITMAPEIEGGIEAITDLVSRGWVVSIGHTSADVDTLDRAYAAGARHMTHFFNAMTGIHHRQVGVAGWGLSNDGVTFDLIADGVHVDPSILRLAVKSKGPGRVSLISDSVAPTGLGDGEFSLWNETVSVVNGRTRNERGSIAGSVATMLDCVRTVLDLGFSRDQVAMMSSAAPARLLGLQDRGSISVGLRADLVELNDAGEIRNVWVAGVPVLGR